MRTCNTLLGGREWAEDAGVSVITTLLEIQKRGRWRTEKSVGRYEKHALLRETSKLSHGTRDYGQLKIDRMSQFLEGALPPLPGLGVSGSRVHMILEARCRAVVRSVLQGWIPLGDVVAVWMTLLSAMDKATLLVSTAVCLLKA